MSHKVIVTSPQNAWGKRHAWTNCLIDFALLFKDACSILTSLSLKTWLVQWNKNVDALFQQMRNDKCINHSDCHVMGSAWHRLGLFGDSTAKNYHGFLMPSLTWWNGSSISLKLLLLYTDYIPKKVVTFWKDTHYSSIFYFLFLLVSLISKND